MDRKQWFLGVTFLILIIIFISFYLKHKEQKLVSTIASYEDCVKAGYPVQESYPSRCIALDNQFTEDIGNEMEYQNEIKLDNPRPNMTVTSPLMITGQARGKWFFEGSFSAELFDENKKSLGIALLTAEGEWMTEEFVSFRGELPFTNPGEKGTLVLKNANPSGLPENDKTLEIPILFK